MAKKYMPKDVFEVGVSTIAKAYLTTGRGLEELANMMWDGYSSSIIDDGVVEDLVKAASKVITWLEDQNAPSIPGLFHHFQYFCINFDDEGKPKKKKLFNGLWFQKVVPQPNRVEDFTRKLQVYYIGARAGVMPLAPEGWSLSNR